MKKVIVHVHRESLTAIKSGVVDGPRPWIVHLEEWPAPRRFLRVVINAPCQTVEGGLPGYTDNPSCGCANAWLEVNAEAISIEYADNFKTIIITNTEPATVPATKTVKKKAK